MFYEYALEPAVISSWDRARFFLDAFGPTKGRFLAKLPKAWELAVLGELKCGDYEKKRIEQKLVDLRARKAYSFRVVRDYPAPMAWLERALAEHAITEFRAIIADLADSRPPVLQAENVDDAEPLWHVDGGQLVPRTAPAVAAAVQGLLAVSRQLVLIDPFFRASQPTKTAVLSACCHGLAQAATRVDIHALLGSDKDPTYEQARADAVRLLPKLLPQRIKTTVRFWLPRHGGGRFHNRYLLTDVGGVQFGDSIEEGGASQLDRLSHLEESTLTQLWEEFMGASPPFDAAGAPFELVGKKPR